MTSVEGLNILLVVLGGGGYYMGPGIGYYGGGGISLILALIVIYRSSDGVGFSLGLADPTDTPLLP